MKLFEVILKEGSIPKINEINMALYRQFFNNFFAFKWFFQSGYQGWFLDVPSIKNLMTVAKLDYIADEINLVDNLSSHLARLSSLLEKISFIIPTLIEFSTEQRREWKR